MTRSAYGRSTRWSAASRLDRRSHLEAVADALQVSITDLTGQPYKPTNRAQARSLAAIPAIRAAILNTAFDERPDLPARPIVALRLAADDVETAREAAAHASYASLLPDLIQELHVHAAGSGSDARTALAALVGAYRSAFVLSKDLGYVDLAWIAADRAMQAAERLDDPAWSAFGGFYRANALLSASARSRARQVAERAADAAAGQLGQAQVMPVYGILHLASALTAVSSNDTGAVDAHIDEAVEIAGRTGETNAFHLHFGPTNVAVWRVSIAVERGDGGKAPEIMRGVDTSVLGSGRRRAQFLTDLGRGLAQARGKDPQALAALREAERLAPELVRPHPLVRETVAVMLERARATAGGRDLRGLAYRMGIA
ncbi:hypothetical protein [Frankia sp. Cr1]|uniref:hypothetical protein n=1 Tax=Frankia sp. Cr1 TaxID=3073931 RepID=UPI002AD42D69|nr:hypothetical protein [Frankia sp. Cr1]